MRLLRFSESSAMKRVVSGRVWIAYVRFRKNNFLALMWYKRQSYPDCSTEADSCPLHPHDLQGKYLGNAVEIFVLM